MSILQFNLKSLGSFDRIFNIGKTGRLPVIQAQLLDGISPVNLTGATVKFTMVDMNNNVIVNAANGTLISATNGIIGYSWAANDVARSGRFYGKFNITVGGVDYIVPDGVNQNLVVNINTAIPVVEPIFITSALTAAGTVGVAFTYQIVAVNAPVSYTAVPLPAGLSVNTGTGAITGTPTTAGVTNCVMTATNADGTATNPLTITIT